MIVTKNDLKFYLDRDLERFENGAPTLKDFILNNEVWYIYRYQRCLRKYEYYYNKKTKGILFYYYLYLYKRLGFKLRITIYPNTISHGLRIFHVGDFIHVKQNCKIGKNCTLLPGVVIGNKNLLADNSKVSVGDNVYFGIGSRVFGEVTIGNNAVVGANSVVIKNIEENTVVSGIPAISLNNKA